MTGRCPLSSPDERLTSDKQRMKTRITSDSLAITSFDKVCEEVTNYTDHEEFFNKKFDQLEKLHELYKSVSSISAASQSRLELNMKSVENKNLLHQRSASFSLTGLMLGDLDNLSLPSTVSDDINSLCSEPAWLTRHQLTQELDINRNSTSCTNSALDLAQVLQLGVDHGPGSPLSLSQLMNGAVTRDQCHTTDRSDSPILEGLDSGLAKYAQLKDLEQAYTPKNDNLFICDNNPETRGSVRPEVTRECLLSPGLTSLRHPDGASNPDLGSVSQRHVSEEARDNFSSMTPVTLPRRSPGTGRSSSGSDAEMELLPQKACPGTRTVAPKQKDNFSPAPGTDNIMSRTTATPGAGDDVKLAEASLRQTPAKTGSDNLASERNNSKDQKTPRIPKFSRLFGNVKKISRSPTQVSSKDEKSRSKASKRQTKTSSQISLKDSGQLKSENLIPTTTGGSAEKPAKSKYRFFERRDKCKSASSVSKNVKGTLSSEPSSDKPQKSSKSRNNSPSLGHKSDKKDKKSGVKTKNQGVSVVSGLASPYSTPGRVRQTRRHVAQSETSGSGYDSGIEIGAGGTLVVSTGVTSSSLVKIRGKGADTLILGAGTSGHGSGQRRSSRSNCKSSGYESIGGESENTSVDSYHATLTSGSQDAEILQYDSDTVTRMDRGWRFQEVKRLKKKQEHLKTELLSAKTRINSDPDNWSYELHTEASGLEHTDPNFVEAFQKETVILDKRVAACKSHVVVSTSFVNKSDKNHTSDTSSSVYEGCSADGEDYSQDNNRLTAFKAAGQL